MKDVMDAAVAQTRNNAGTSVPTFEYEAEPLSSGNLGVNAITIIHRKGSAKSRQTENEASTGRVYPNGIYHFADDGFMTPNSPTEPLKPMDPNKAFVGAWQYYIYDTEGRDLARVAKAEGRKIVPFDQSPPNGYEIKDGYTIVWRIVTIFVRSTHDDKGEMATKFVQGSVKI